jgi:hypothetical protein
LPGPSEHAVGRGPPGALTSQPQWRQLHSCTSTSSLVAQNYVGEPAAHLAHHPHPTPRSNQQPSGSSYQLSRDQMLHLPRPQQERHMDVESVQEGTRRTMHQQPVLPDHAACEMSNRQSSANHGMQPFELPPSQRSVASHKHLHLHNASTQKQQPQPQQGCMVPHQPWQHVNACSSDCPHASGHASGHCLAAAQMMQQSTGSHNGATAQGNQLMVGVRDAVHPVESTCNAAAAASSPGNVLAPPRDCEQQYSPICKPTAATCSNSHVWTPSQASDDFQSPPPWDGASEPAAAAAVLGSEPAAAAALGSVPQKVHPQVVTVKLQTGKPR